MKYALAYNAFHNLESIGIEGKTEKLAAYAYKNGSGKLKSIAYANGQVMKASYNAIGQMTAEKWYADADAAAPIAHYKYVYDGQGNIVRSIDIVQRKEYTYTYENGRIVRAAESDITLGANEVITGKTLVNAIVYSYDADDKLTRKRILSADGNEQTIWYENPEDGSPVVKFSAGGKTITAHSKTDSFGRKVFDELQLGTGFVSRQFHYHAGAVTQEHIDAAKLKSSATTQLVSQIVLSNGRTLSYEYDAEERITKVTDSVDGITEYTYDALGQLLTETKDGETINTMVYDNYGNIVSKNGTAYTYGDEKWKDLLTKVGDTTISYDAQGNPTSYLGHTLTWEKGRQLKSFDNTQYTYNANGIRTSKTVNGVEHTFVLDGTKILKESWGSNTIIPMYDNEDNVCGIIYNDVPYYFFKNLQGDVIAIVDKDAQTVAKYSYDAWGVCTVAQNSSDCNIASVNPFRYRGYYYDSEIGLYYLQSRYYNPTVGRFVNADEAGYLLTEEGIAFASLLAYCVNEPIGRIDKYGNASGYIDDQNDPSWKRVAVGFWGNVKDNGCGAIAIYNVLRSYSSNITINTVLSNLRWMYGSVIYNNIGLIGISPVSVTNYLRSKFWFICKANSITFLWGIKAELSGAVIVLYQHRGWNSSFHYVAGIKTGSGYGGSFRFYNDRYYKDRYGVKSISIWKCRLVNDMLQRREAR